MSKKNKVVAFDIEPLLKPLTGVGVYTYEIITRLRKDENYLFQGNMLSCFGRKKLHGRFVNNPLKLSICKIMSYGIYRRLWHKVPIRYNSLFNPADITVFFDYIVPPRISGKVITVIHDLTFLRFPDTMNFRTLKRIRKDIQYSVDRADKIITVSEFSRKEMIDLLGIPSSKIEIVKCAPTQIPVQSSISFCDLPEVLLSNYEDYILFVGTVEPRKNLSILIEAFDILKSSYKLPHKLVIAGGKGWNNRSFFSEVEMAKYKSDIILTGYVSDKEKWALYKHASIFVFPSVYEGFGIPPLEAMAMGCPVACSNTASLPEVVGDAALLFNPYNSNEIVHCIESLISDTPLRSKKIAMGYNRVKAFSWDESAQKIMEIITHMLD